MKLHNETIIKYLKLVEHTEPPVLHHIWSLISMMSANLGRRCYFEFGSIPILPNQYVLLVGDPGVRKSTAIGLAKKMIKGNTSIRLAPDDTGGQRQGLISAMQAEEINPEELFAGLDQAEEYASAAPTVHPEDRHSMFVLASEFASFLGLSSYELIVFLTKMWDGEDHTYSLKNSKQVLENPLINILGGTTPIAISTALPMEVVGQGFLSRVILVYAESSVKIPRPQALAEDGVAEIRKIFNYVSNEFTGPFKETAKAATRLDEIYLANTKIEDTRFVYYKTRRHTHLIKLTMALAALRGSQEIIIDDVEDAQNILSLTEESMPNALGEFGLSPLGTAKQKLLEFIRQSEDPFTVKNLWSLMQRDMKLEDFTQTLKDFVSEGKILAWEDHGIYKYYANKNEEKTRKVTLEDLL